MAPSLRAAGACCARLPWEIRSGWRSGARTKSWKGSASTACNIGATSGAAPLPHEDLDLRIGSMNPAAVHTYLLDLQNRLVAELERIEGRSFRSDQWQRSEGGGGESRIIEDGDVFERGGVNFSRVHGERPPPPRRRRAARARRPRVRSGRRVAGAASAQSLRPARSHEHSVPARDQAAKR